MHWYVIVFATAVYDAVTNAQVLKTPTSWFYDSISSYISNTASHVGRQDSIIFVSFASYSQHNIIIIIHIKYCKTCWSLLVIV